MKFKRKDFRYYKFKGMFELPRWLDLFEFTWMLVKLVEKVGGYTGGGFVEVDEGGKAVKHLEAECVEIGANGKPVQHGKA